MAANRPRHCPHCGKPVPSRQRDWQLLVQAAGRCLRCNKDKPDADMPFRNCRPCRLIIADNARKRYAKKRIGAGGFVSTSRGRQVAAHRGAA